MPGKADIRAGGAFVELFVKGAKLEQGLKKGSALLSDFGQKAQAVGTQIAAIGSAAVAGFAVAVKQFADSGDELVKMSERTGMSVKALSELRYAAGQSDASLHDIEKSMKRLASVLTDATNGSKAATATLEQLGLSIADLQGLSPDEQFMKTALALASVEDATTRAALAQDVFGKTGTALLPLLSEGEKGLEAMRKEAERLGVTMDEKTARSGVSVGDAFDRVKSALSGTANAIGAALAPKLTELANRIAFGIGQVNAWIAQHKELVVIAAKAAVVLTGLGIAIAAVGTAAVTAGAAVATMVSIVSGIIAIATVITPPLALIAAACAALALDAIVVGTAITATAGAFLYASGIVPQLVSALAPLVDAVKAIASALLEGDFRKAWDIAATAIKYFGSVAMDVFRQIPEFAGYAAGKITKALIDGFTKAWDWILSQMKTVLTGMLSAAANFAPQLLAAMFSGNFTSAAANIAFAMKGVLEEVNKTATDIGAEFGGAFQAGFDGADGPKLDASKKTADLREALNKMVSEQRLKEAAKSATRQMSLGMGLLLPGSGLRVGGGTSASGSPGGVVPAPTDKKPEIDLSALDQYKQRIDELDAALAKDTITQAQYDAGIQQIRRDVLDLHDPVQEFRDRVALLDEAVKRGTMSHEEFVRQVQAAKNALVDQSPIERYMDRLRELKALLAAGIINPDKFAAEQDMLRRDATGIDQTPIEKYMSRIKELKALFDAGLIDPKQFKAEQLKALPDKVKSIIEEAKSPLERFNEQITEARDFLKQGLITEEQFANRQEKLQKQLRGEGNVFSGFSAGELIAQGIGSQGGRIGGGRLAKRRADEQPVIDKNGAGKGDGDAIGRDVPSILGQQLIEAKSHGKLLKSIDEKTKKQVFA